MSDAPPTADSASSQASAVESVAPRRDNARPNRVADIPMIVFLAAATTLGAHTLFYHLAPSIWRRRSTIPVGDFLIWKGIAVNEGDRIESPVLMLFALATCVVTAAAAAGMSRLSRRAMLPLGVLLPILFVAFATSVGLALPYESPLPVGLKTLAPQGVALAFALLCAWVTRLSSQRPSAPFYVRWSSELLVLLVVVPFSFTAAQTWRAEEWGYFLSASLQIIDGAPLDSLYLQYDLFLTLVGVLWIKLGFNIEYFHIVGQIAWVVFFVGIFAFAKRLFRNTHLAAYLVCAVIVARTFAIYHDPVFCLQTTPIRLDLWLLVVAIAHFKGPTHVALGTTIGLLVFLFRSIGLLVLGAFLAFVAIDVVCACLAEPKPTRTFVATALRHLRLYARNLALALCFTLLATLVFGNLIPPAVTDYQEYALGFLKTPRKSFFWWVIVAYAVLATLWWCRRTELPIRARQTILFFMILGFVHLTYYTGRSHDQNLLHLSGSIFFAIFLAIDFVIASGAPHAPPRLSRFLPVIFLAFVVHSHSGRLTERLKSQSSIWFGSESRHRPALPDPACHVIEKETKGVGKVFFFSRFDFQFYYACRKVPQGRLQPLDAHIFRSALAEFLRDFLRAGNTIVVPRAEEAHYRDGANRLRMKVAEVVSGPFIFVRDGTANSNR